MRGRIGAVLGLSWCCSLAWAAPVGTFTEVQGGVRFLRGDYFFAAAEGVEVEAQDVIETESDAAAQLELADKSVLKLGARTRLSLSEYRLNADNSVARASVELLSGWLRFAVAKLRRNAEYRIDTATLAIGIRGTEGVIEADAVQGGLLMHSGEVEVRAPDVADLAAVPVRAGEFLQRWHRQEFYHPAVVPAAFQQRVPAPLQPAIQRRAAALPPQAVSATPLRRLAPPDVRQWLKDHPHMRPLLQQRLRRYLEPPSSESTSQLPEPKRRGLAPADADRKMPRPAPRGADDSGLDAARIPPLSPRQHAVERPPAGAPFSTPISPSPKGAPASAPRSLNPAATTVAPASTRDPAVLAPGVQDAVKPRPRRVDAHQSPVPNASNIDDTAPKPMVPRREESSVTRDPKIDPVVAPTRLP